MSVCVYKLERIKPTGRPFTQGGRSMSLRAQAVKNYTKPTGPGPGPAHDLTGLRAKHIQSVLFVRSRLEQISE